MKPGAWLINVAARRAGRRPGAACRRSATNRIGGAVLDTFRDEPLPPTSPFYDLSNVIVTPHTSWSSGRVLDRSVELFCDNLRRFATGEPLLNVVDPTAGTDEPASLIAWRPMTDPPRRYVPARPRRTARWESCRPSSPPHSWPRSGRRTPTPASQVAMTIGAVLLAASWLRRRTAAGPLLAIVTGGWFALVGLLLSTSRAAEHASEGRYNPDGLPHRLPGRMTTP